MIEQYKMAHYQPDESMDLEHTLIYTFQYENAYAQLITIMSGNVSGGNAMTTEFDCGFTVPVDQEINKKHAIFYDDEDRELPYREVGGIIYYYPDGETIEIGIEVSSDFLVGIQIIDCKSND